MSDVFLALGGVVLGGILTIAASAWQIERQFVHQRNLAKDDHERKQVVVENERLRPRLESQLTHGRRVAFAAMRFKSRTNGVMDEAQLRQVLLGAIRVAGLDFNAPSPFPEFLTDTEIEDGDSRDLISHHRQLMANLDAILGLGDADPREIPGWPELGEVDELTRRIEARYRVLQREGLPL